MHYAKPKAYEFIRLGEHRWNLRDILQTTKLSIQAHGIYQEENRCMSMKETAEFLGVCTASIKSGIKSGRIKAIVLHDRYCIPRIQFLDQILHQWKDELQQLNNPY